ncbi:MAG: glutamine--fructose-6-phosphate transaminase (isomerizing) [Coriobacteriales bacterium]|jgi:glucosamine--fructose-6-phosphate aminotransferase (isomerizing)|nr:glutamine--fructose-6-phosphate transaminase (isomerizing) [Coriobacteriales bacterium]
MCGIVAFTGKAQALPFLLDGLRRLEYRGYDSAGVAIVQRGTQSDAPDLVPTPNQGGNPDLVPAPNQGGNPDLVSTPNQGDDSDKLPALMVVRRKGKVAALAEALSAVEVEGTCGIGHTRWATHGVPSEQNAHPHVDCHGRIAIAHNGIIENYAHLKERLLEQGHHFASQTDSEVIAHLIEQNYRETAGNLIEAVRATVAQLSGSFALAILHAGHPDVVIVTRNDSPLVLGSFEGGACAASDTPALIERTRDVVYIRDRDLAVLHEDGRIEYFDPAGEPFVPNTYHVEWNLEEAEKGGYPDFMLKEISEQPRVIRDMIANRFDTKTRTLRFEELPLTDEELADIDRIYIVACGTSYHAGLIGKDLIENWARIPVEVEVASEFRYGNPIISTDTLVIAISQSGETADTLEAVRLARHAGAHVIALTNVVGSRITQEAQTVLNIKAHIEIAVAATKSFLAQVTLLTLLGLYFAQERLLLTGPQIQEIFGEMRQLPEQIERILANTAPIERAAVACFEATSALFIGRGVGATTCYEGALKLKEISYLHAEAFSAGEIKHGPIALIDPDAGTPVIAVATQSATRDKMLANIEEMKARGARVVAVATEGDERIEELADYVMYIPPTRECLSPITASVPLQLFARYVAVARGCDVDQPRNLAKSVTVE